MLNYYSQDFVCRCLSKGLRQELVVVQLVTLTSSHYNSKDLSFHLDWIFNAYYHSGLLAVSLFNGRDMPISQRFRCFKFDVDAGKLIKVALPFTGIPLNQRSGDVSAFCVNEKRICAAIGSKEKTRILVWNRQSNNLVVTLLDPDLKAAIAGRNKYYTDITIHGNTIAAVTMEGRVAQ